MKKIFSALMTAVLIVSMLAVPVFAVNTPTEAEIKDIFKDMGISTWGSGYFGCHMMNPEGDPAPDGVVHQYIQSAGLLKGYEYERMVTDEYGTYPEYGYELPYKTYMEIIDGAFVNHSDMKSYLNNEWSQMYNENTGIVSWRTGGFGGPTDWVVQDICYYSDDLIYVNGVMVEFAYDASDFIGKEEYFDYITVNASFGTDTGMLESPILLTLQKKDGKWKILEYRENSWYVAGGILYETEERVKMYPLEKEAGGALVEADDNSSDFTTGFYGHSTSWYNENAQLSYRITAKAGYTLDGVTLKDDKGTRKIEAVDGVYVIAPEGKAVLCVSTVRAPVDIEISKEQENKTLKLSSDNADIFAVANQSVSQLSSSVNENVEVLKADGTKAENTDKIASGMMIIVKDDNGNEIDFKTVVVPGDVDGDAEIKASDARLALRASVNLEELSSWSSAAADVDGANEIKAADARKILRASVSLENSADWLPALS